MSQENYSSTDVIFLLGAGASVDAGMPTVKELTHCIKKRLPDLKDINGNRTAAFKDIFDSIAKVDNEVNDNYEKFFKYIHLITSISEKPQKELFCAKLPDLLVEKVWHLRQNIGDLVKNILNEFQSKAQPDYLSCIADFITEKGRLKVFTLNYDLCVELACKSKRISLITGFENNWNPYVFNNIQSGINLYKLHGSINWFCDDKWNIKELPTSPRGESPQLVLGPGSKIQADDPFLTLFYEFHKAVQDAEVCIVLGYGYRDEHVNTVLGRGKCTIILDINIQSHHSKFGNIGRKRIEMIGSTKDLLIKGDIKRKLHEVINRLK